MVAEGTCQSPGPLQKGWGPRGPPSPSPWHTLPRSLPLACFRDFEREPQAWAPGTGFMSYQPSACAASLWFSRGIVCSVSDHSRFSRAGVGCLGACGTNPKAESRASWFPLGVPPRGCGAPGQCMGEPVAEGGGQDQPGPWPHLLSHLLQEPWGPRKGSLQGRPLDSLGPASRPQAPPRRWDSSLAPPAELVRGGGEVDGLPGGPLQSHSHSTPPPPGAWGIFSPGLGGPNPGVSVAETDLLRGQPWISLLWPPRPRGWGLFNGV